MQAQAQTANPAKLPKLRVMSSKHVEALETLLHAYRVVKEREKALAAHDHKRATMRDALQQQADEAYANFCDAMDQAAASGAVDSAAVRS